MKSLGPKDTFPLAGFLQKLPTSITYMPTLCQGQKLIAGGKEVEDGEECLTICTTDDEVEVMRDLYDHLSWYILPPVTIGMMISQDEIIIVVVGS